MSFYVVRNRLLQIPVPDPDVSGCYLGSAEISQATTDMSSGCPISRFFL